MASLYGEIFRGGYVARGTKVLKQIPIRTVNFENKEEKAKYDAIVERQKQLIVIGDKIATAEGNRRKQTPLLRQFDSLKQEPQAVPRALYYIDRITA